MHMLLWQKYVLPEQGAVKEERAGEGRERKKVTLLKMVNILSVHVVITSFGSGFEDRGGCQRSTRESPREYSHDCGYKYTRIY